MDRIGPLDVAPEDRALLGKRGVDVAVRLELEWSRRKIIRAA